MNHRPIHHVCHIVDDPTAETERLEAAGHDAPLLGHAIEVHENTDAIKRAVRAVRGWG
jgi:hypothetical protein